MKWREFVSGVKWKKKGLYMLIVHANKKGKPIFIFINFEMVLQGFILLLAFFCLHLIGTHSNL